MSFAASSRKRHLVTNEHKVFKSLKFVPANAMKEVTGRIMRIQERYAREVDRLGFDLAPNQYQYMMAVISTVQSEVTAPIVIINTP